MASMQDNSITVGDDQAGMRVDRLVADWRGVSRAAVLRLLEAGGLTINGRSLGRSDKGRVVLPGDVLAIADGFMHGETIRPGDSQALDILAEGAGWVAVNKPAGMPVRPHELNEAGSVLNHLVASYPQINGVGEGGLRSGVVHRLDNDTSGVLIVATEQDTWQQLRERFAKHDIEKRYCAILQGTPDEEGSLELPLRVSQHRPARVVVCDGQRPHVEARDCSLAWRVIERLGNHASLVEVDLHTGFLHQVRVMMAHLGCPVMGDAVYGHAQSQAPRQMLHAASLRFEDQSIEAPLPEDMQRVMQRLRLDSV